MRGIDTGTGQRDMPRHIKQILHRERHASQHTGIAARRDRCIDGMSLRQGAFLRHGGKGLVGVAPGGDACECVLRDAGGLHFARAYVGCNAQCGWVRTHGSNRDASSSSADNGTSNVSRAKS